MAKQTTGEFLATLRKAHGYTQSEVAEKLNISDRTLSSWETDRTLPDLLLLPTIADMYGVTVDEILRGERTTKTELNKISEKALLSSRKKHYGKFLMQSSLIYGIAITISFVLLLTSVILPYTTTPLWLNILLFVTGGICIAVSMTLMFYFEYKLRVKEGIILKDDFTSENKALLLAAKRKIYNLTLITSLILVLDIFILLMELLFVKSYLLPIILLIIYCVACVSLLLFSIIYRKVNISAYGTDEQIDVLKSNRKLAKKVYCISILPTFAVLAILFILWLLIPATITPDFESSDFDKFRTHTQTLNIMEGSTAVVHYNYKAGDYQLNFPEEPQENVYYDLNEAGIYGKKTYVENAWTLYYKYEDEYQEIMTALIMKLNGNSFVNVRYARFFDFYLDFHNNYYVYPNVKIKIEDKFYGEKETDEHFDYKDGKYGFYSEIYRDFSNEFSLAVCIGSLSIIYLITTIVYLSKRKTIQYEY